MARAQIKWLLRILVALTASAVSVDAGAQQQMNFGPSPYGGPPAPEFIVPAGGIGGLFAVTTPANTIIYDVGRFQPYGGIGGVLFQFSRAHEYAHLLLGHAHMPMSQDIYFQNELIADCEAAKHFGWQSTEIQMAALAYQQVLPPGDMPGMPGGVRRIQNLRACGGG
jgi:hypothetical protein